MNAVYCFCRVNVSQSPRQLQDPMKATRRNLSGVGDIQQQGFSLGVKFCDLFNFRVAGLGVGKVGKTMLSISLSLNVPSLLNPRCDRTARLARLGVP